MNTKYIVSLTSKFQGRFKHYFLFFFKSLLHIKTQQKTNNISTSGCGLLSLLHHVHLWTQWHKTMNTKSIFHNCKTKCRLLSTVSFGNNVSAILTYPAAFVSLYCHYELLNTINDFNPEVTHCSGSSFRLWFKSLLKGFGSHPSLLVILRRGMGLVPWRLVLMTHLSKDYNTNISIG